MPFDPTTAKPEGAGKFDPSTATPDRPLSGSFLQRSQQAEQQTEQAFQQKTGKKMMEDPVGFAGFALTDPQAQHRGFETLPAVGPGEGLMRSRPSLFRGPKPTDQQTLRQAGVMLTPGQQAGGIVRWGEQLAKSFPILGYFIHNAETQTLESFNRAIFDQSLAPISRKLPKDIEVGHDAFNFVDKQFDEAYGRVKGLINFRLDREAIEDLKEIQAAVSELPPERVTQFETVLRNRVFSPGRMQQADARLNGEQFKLIESDLGRIASEYRGSPDPDQRIFGSHIDEVKLALRSALERNNPEAAEQLKAINSGYAMFVRAQGAATRRATSGAAFTPNDLLQAIQRQDKSLRKSMMWRGDNVLQPFSEAASRVLPSKYPDSGTAGRFLAYEAAKGVLAGGGYGAGLVPPEMLAALGGASLAYTRPGIRAFNALTRGSAEAVSPTVADALRGE